MARACLALTSKVMESDKSWGRSPKNLGSAIVYLVGNIQLDYDWSQKRISEAGGSTGSGMRNVYKFIYETWKKLVVSKSPDAVVRSEVNEGWFSMARADEMQN